MRTRFTELIGIELPIVQAPMAGASDAVLAAAVASAGGLGSLPCAMLSADDIRREWGAFRAATDRPVNLNFFCHAPPDADPARMDAWRERLAAYYAELSVDADVSGPSTERTSFDEALTEVVEELSPPVVSFHFGLPADTLVERVRATGARLMSSATTVAEARWLEDHGCDVVIAQGIEAGGHRGMFLTDDLATQVGTMALVPQVVDAVEVPVIAAGGIADGRGIAAALTLGAEAVQVGTAFLRCPEARTGELHREALAAASEDATALTNVFTGRPARGIVNRVVAEVGPLTDAAPAFPTAFGALMPLRAAAEGQGSTDFTPLWSGQAARLARDVPAATLTRLLADEARQCLARLATTT
jgi:nitronate monooxygenase